MVPVEIDFKDKDAFDNIKAALTDVIARKMK